MLNREHVSDALRFWEPARIVFNIVLAIVAIVVAPQEGLWPPPQALWLSAASTLVILAAIANILYCAAYPVDLFIQSSNLREIWRGWRWALWALGTLLGASLVILTLRGASGLMF